MRVHPIVAERTAKGLFHVLYRDLRRKVNRIYPEKFIAFCRLTIPAFDRLLTILAPELTFADTVMGKAISAEERLHITLRFLATGESYTSLPIVMPSPTEETWL
ncbi:uncharacterized protein LOC143769951 [Ranitomeya variabilis]|uniref:uncharacterized protein LOC143769951 n=1 Tax=Ranitomeya variabilis TaxID=490064 RepID=UPI004056B9E4